MKPIRVLVTGAGSGVGQGIFKSLRIASLPITIVIADISPLNAAIFRADEAVILPKVETQGALEQVLLLIKKNNIDVIMIGSEFDLEFFATNKHTIQSETGALVIASPLETVMIANDKWLTAEYLRKNNLPYAEAYVPSEITDAIEVANTWRYPIMLKTRQGTSNRHVHVVKKDEEMIKLFSSVPMPMLQKMIALPANSLATEYTCSIFKCREGNILGPFTCRRTLRAGNSWIIEVIHFEELYPLLMEIGQKTNFIGSLNIQLMVGPHGPVPFEFNARFSGTTAVRAHFGFNEPEMAIRSFLLKEKIEQPTIQTGLAFRYLEEVFVNGVTAEGIQKSFPKGITRPWF